MSCNIFLAACTPVNLYNQNNKTENIQKEIREKQENILTNNKVLNQKNIIPEKVREFPTNTKLSKTVTVLFSNKNNISKQFINILELGVYNKGLGGVKFEIRNFENTEELKAIIKDTAKDGKIYVGLIDNYSTEVAKSFCDKNIIFLSFASQTNLADECVYLFNFFPKNELEQLFKYLNSNSKVALLYPENKYGYKINSLIDDVANNSEAIIINRASYKQDLSNVRDAIKELSKYELRKYELERQKKILVSKKDNKSIKRLKKLQKFQTTNDYDFTHILIADYGINLLQVAPLLPYYDVDPNLVQFMGTGVVDDENFFFEPSLQGTIFPGVVKNKRNDLIYNYKNIYNDNFKRVSTLPYDLIGLLNYIFLNEMTLVQFKELLSDSEIKFEGIDGNFNFKNNMIHRELSILKITNGFAKPIN